MYRLGEQLFPRAAFTLDDYRDGTAGRLGCHCDNPPHLWTSMDDVLEFCDRLWPCLCSLAHLAIGKAANIWYELSGDVEWNVGLMNAGFRGGLDQARWI